VAIQKQKHLNWSTSMSDTIALFQNQRVWAQIKPAVMDLVDQDHNLGLAQNGSLTHRLEQELAQHFGRQHCVTTGSCSDALTIAVLALNLPAGSRVAVSNYTFTATAHAVARAGHVAMPIDVGNNYCIDTAQIKDCQAVIAVDIFGNMSDWHQLDQLGIPVICDAAQSFESRTHGWSAQQGIISCVSFSPSKTISSWGSGGALLTDNSDIAAQARKLRLHGKTNNNQVSIHAGMNTMLSSFEAACVLTGLEHADAWQKRRQQIADYLVSGSEYPCAIDFDQAQHTLHKLVFQADNRNHVITDFANAGVDCAVHYATLINDEPLYHVGKSFPVSDRLKTTSFTVPNQHTLTDSEVERIGKLLT
jgi:dTDP-4-amino-4,6-dideoxygalactose transaminase